MKNKNIIFIGFMGVGKTSIGKMVASKLGCSFVDTDQVIEQRNSITIEEIFARFGEKYFRTLEEDLVKEISNKNKIVISTGGGVVLNSANVSNLKKNGFVILLEASPETIYKNILKEDNRPLIKSDNPLGAIEQLLSKREEFYNVYDYKIAVDNLSIDQIADKILSVLKEKSIV